MFVYIYLYIAIYWQSDNTHNDFTGHQQRSDYTNFNTTKNLQWQSIITTLAVGVA